MIYTAARGDAGNGREVCEGSSRAISEQSAAKLGGHESDSSITIKLAMAVTQNIRASHYESSSIGPERTLPTMKTVGDPAT